MRTLLVIALMGLALAACRSETAVKDQTAALTLSAKHINQRVMQMRRFDTRDERMLLSACSGVLQDLGFSIDESSVPTGLLVASKDRDAIEEDQVAGQVFFAALIIAMGGQADPVWDRNQKIRVSVTVKPTLDNSATIARATFQRVVWNTKNQVSKAETINDAVIYQTFFDKLSQSVFLEANQI